MNNPRRPNISFVLATFNRRTVLTETLARVKRCGLDRRDYEIIVVDNGSNDGTPNEVAPEVDTLIELRHNGGSCAKSHGVDRARGRYIVFLDDDSFPHPGSVGRMISRFEEDARLGAAGFVVHLPDGRREGSALPDVFLGCGVGLRSVALRSVGGLDRSFFMQAEEYDLTFRLASRGWRVRMFDDLHVDHLKTACARKAERTTYYDIRNNLRVVARYLPSPHHEIYRAEALQRYAWLAQRDGHSIPFARGVLTGLWRAALERKTYRPYRLTPAGLEHFFRWEYAEHRMADLAAAGVGRIILADLGKNVYAYYRAARETGMTIPAIADDRLCVAGRYYREVPILPLEEALSVAHDAVVVANSSAVHGTTTYNALAGRLASPVHHWFGPRDMGSSDEIHSSRTVELADSRIREPAAAAST